MNEKPEGNPITNPVVAFWGEPGVKGEMYCVQADGTLWRFNGWHETWEKASVKPLPTKDTR